MKAHRLRQHLTWKFLLAAAVPLLLFLLIGVGELIPRLDQEDRLRQEQLATAIAAQVESHLSAAVSMSRAIAFTLIDSRQNSVSVQRLLEAEVVANRFIRAAYVVGEDERVFAVAMMPGAAKSARDLLGIDLSRNRVVSQVRESGREVWSDMFLSAIASGPAVAFATPADEEIVVAELSLDYLTAYLGRVSIEPGSLLLILDQYGRIIADQNGTYTAQQLNISNLEFIRTGIQGGKILTREFTFADEDYAGTLIDVPLLKWHVLVAKPVTEIHRSAHIALMAGAVSLLFAVFLGMGLAIWSAHHLARNIERLAEHSRKVKEAALGREVPVLSPLPQSNTVELRELATDFQEMADALHDRELQLANLMKNLPGVVYRCRDDDRQTVVFISEPCLELTGYSPGEFLAGEVTLAARMSPDQGAATENEMPASRGESAYVRTCRLLRKDGSPVWVCDYGRPTFDAHGVRYLEGVIVDISDRVAIEEELIRSRRFAEAASQAKSEFLANMSHELRTPLNGVIGSLQLLETLELTPEQREYIELCYQSSTALLDLLNDILDLTRIEAGKLRIEEQPVVLGELVETVRKMFELQLRRKPVAFSARIAPELPPTIRADRKCLLQILFNLVGNAVKFTPQGRIDLTLEAVPRADEEHRLRLRLRVADTGIGVEPERRDDILKPFVQGDNVYVKRFQGVGLGLAIVKRLAEAMGGKILLESEVNRGTTVTVEVMVGGGEQAAPSLAPGSGAVAAPGRALQILLAEDNLVNQRLLQAMLARQGHRVVTAADGVAVLARLREEDFDLVLMDVQMPVMDGLEAFEQIRSGSSGVRDPAVPVVALTAYAMPEDEGRFLAAGMDGYLQKPVSMERLSALLGRYRR